MAKRSGLPPRAREHGTAYQYRWRGLDGRDRSEVRATIPEIHALDREVRAAHAAGHEWEPSPLRGRTLLSDVARAFIDARRARGLRTETLRVDGTRLDIFARFCAERGVRFLDELRRPLLDDFLAWCMKPETARHKQQRAAVSAGRIVGGVVSLWEWADNSERWPECPRARRIDLPAVEEDEPVAPTWAEMDAVIAAWPDPDSWLRRLATWLRYTGLRAGESMRLLWSDVDVDGGTVTIRAGISKTKKGRTVPLCPHLINEIATWGKREGYLLPSARTGEQERIARTRDAAAAWARSGARPEIYAGQPWHAFRAGFKSGLLAIGATPDAVDYLQGHRLGSGARGRYIAAFALRLQETVAMVPQIGASSANVVRLPAVGQELANGARK